MPLTERVSQKTTKTSHDRWREAPYRNALSSLFSCLLSLLYACCRRSRGLRIQIHQARRSAPGYWNSIGMENHYFFFFLSCANMKMRRGAFAEASAAGWPRRLLFPSCSFLFSVAGFFFLFAVAAFLSRTRVTIPKGNNILIFEIGVRVLVVV
jgi:hypothetical protein